MKKKKENYFDKNFAKISHIVAIVMVGIAAYNSLFGGKDVAGNTLLYGIANFLLLNSMIKGRKD